MSTWEGKHRDDLIQKWGPPTQETTLSKGGSSLVYLQNWANQYDAGYAAWFSTQTMLGLSSLGLMGRSTAAVLKDYLFLD